jgi:hypothetical protein
MSGASDLVRQLRPCHLSDPLAATSHVTQQLALMRYPNFTIKSLYNRIITDSKLRYMQGNYVYCEYTQAHVFRDLFRSTLSADFRAFISEDNDCKMFSEQFVKNNLPCTEV